MLDTKKEYLMFSICVLTGAIIGNVIGSTLKHDSKHVCECEYCKAVRQRETVEIVDSIFHERIVININKE